MTSPTQDVETIYKAAEALQAAHVAALAAYAAINRAPAHAQEALDRPLYSGDLDTLAKALNALADQWQEEIDHD